MADLQSVLDIETGTPWQGLPAPGTVEARVLALLARSDEVRPAEIGLSRRLDVFVAAIDRLNDLGWTIVHSIPFPHGNREDRAGYAALASRVQTSAGVIWTLPRPSKRDHRCFASKRFKQWLAVTGAHALSSAEAAA